ncbi:MAG: hypothetical protein JSW65_01300 [Candidatus Bipolaricaulota bacterium]|nr:MAG: hypothetical protein JSW65_01300 [Candidatus Bipolaricaulota bacterium]
MTEQSTAQDGLWEQLVARVGEDDARFLVSTLEHLDPPGRISDLAKIEAEQEARGAGFLGMLPSQTAAPLPVPEDPDAVLATALALAEIREGHLEAIRSAFGDSYALTFTGQELPAAAEAPLPQGWALELDVSGIRAVLDYIAAGRSDQQGAMAVARMAPFQEMMRHRRELGYVPEPLIDDDGFAWCLMKAGSDDPVHAIWRWLSPHNLFDLADLAQHHSQFEDLVARLEGQGELLGTAILSRLAPFAPKGAPFVDRLTFAVGWAIRGWATDVTGGINIEHIKDDFAQCLDTLVHETFHRLQLRICPKDPLGKTSGFESLTVGSYGSSQDQVLYRALCYVMLEGSATYVGGGVRSEGDEARGAGIDLLERVLDVDADRGDETSDALLNEGLKSNGPFYGLGARMSQAIVDRDGSHALGEALAAGAPAFFTRALEADRTLAERFPGRLLSSIRRLVS